MFGGKLLFLVTLLVVIYMALGQRYIIYPHHMPHVQAAPIYHMQHMQSPYMYRPMMRSPVVYYGDGYDSVDGFNT